MSSLDTAPPWTVEIGDAYDILSALPNHSVDLILTSPPYWGLRDYEADHNWEILNDWKAEGHEAEKLPSFDWYRKHGGLLGLEPLPEWYVAHLIEIIDRGKNVLKPNGSLWLNLGDTYFARWSSIRSNGRQGLNGEERMRRKTPMGGFRQEKQLLMIPARVAIGLQERRWILRNDLIWYKPNVPPRPFKDRLGSTHEHFFHFVKRPTEGRPTYFYDIEQAEKQAHDVIQVNTDPGRDGHSATFPERLIEPRILSSCPQAVLCWIHFVAWEQRCVWRLSTVTELRGSISTPALWRLLVNPSHKGVFMKSFQASDSVARDCQRMPSRRQLRNMGQSPMNISVFILEARAARKTRKPLRRPRVGESLGRDREFTRFATLRWD